MLTSNILLLLVAVAPSQHIDRLLNDGQRAADVSPVAICSDDAFLRRVTLDLAGRIPTRIELTAFRADPDRNRKIGELLTNAEFPRFWSEVWTASLLGYATRPFGISREPLRAWLEEAIRDERPYDDLVRQLIAAEGDSAFDGPVNFLLRHRDEPVVKVSRLFLGVRMDCARCHDHPFAKWKREDFDRFQQFFQGVSIREVSERNFHLSETPREISGNANQQPRFLTGAAPKTSRWRDEVGLLITSCRPFARNYANRIWYQLLGRGIVDPPDDFSASEAVAPELLEYLADYAVETDFQLRPLVRAICRSDAYQRESGHATESDASHRLFGSYSPKPLTIEQQMRSLQTAFDVTLTPLQVEDRIREAVRESPDEDYSQTWEYRDTVQQVLSQIVRDVPVRHSSVASIYENILSRSPTAEELQLCRGRPAAQIVFALVHSNEFRFSH